jgi:Family of unknown function (DUF6544)
MSPFTATEDSELFWTPHAIAANHELRWREVDGHAVEVATALGPADVALRFDFDEHGDTAMASTFGIAGAFDAAGRRWRGSVRACLWGAAAVGRRVARSA